MKFSGNKIYRKHTKWTDSSSPAFPTRLSLLACIIIAAGGIIFGMLEDSLAVQTNGFLAAIDILNSILFLTAVNQSIRSPDVSFNYGYGKYESLAILASSGLLFLVLSFTLYQTVIEFGAPSPVGNYYLLIGFSIFTFITMRRMATFQNRAAERFHMPMLKYDAALWKADSVIELVVIANLALGAVLGLFNQENSAKIIDSVVALMIVIYAVKVPLKHGKEALNQLLDKTLPEHIQFDILAVIVENFKRMCEFKAVHTRRSGKDIFIEIDIVMPYNMRLYEMNDLESDIKEALLKKYPTSLPRIYVTPCNRDCIHQGKSNCPVKTALEQNR